MSELICRSVVNAEDVEYMRQIYNSSILALSTHAIPVQTYHSQQDWWATAKATNRAFLYYKESDPFTPIAFSKLCDRGSFATPIFAIVSSEWGHGYGKHIINDYIQRAGKPLAGEQLQSNAPICHLNSRVGWQIIGYRMTHNGLVDLLYHPGVYQDYHAFEAVDKYLHDSEFVHDFAVHGDARGSLTSLEVGKELPFAPKRLYYIYGTNQQLVRGNHSHKHLHQLLLCLNGSFTLKLDFGFSYVRTHEMARPNQAVYVPSGAWRTLENLSKDCVILSIVDDIYTEEDYIRKYTDFQKSRGMRI